MDLLFRTAFGYFQPNVNIPHNTVYYDLLKHTANTMVQTGIKQAIQLPSEVPLNKWLTVQTIDIYNFCNKTYGVLHAAFCNDYRCPIMTAGPKYEYTWMDGEKFKEPIICTAPQHIGYVMTWIRKRIDNQYIFPMHILTQYPPNFLDIVKEIMKHLLRIYAHMYYIHYNELVILSEAKLINAGLMHILYFVIEFQLVEESELEPFKDYLNYLSVNDPAGTNIGNEIENVAAAVNLDMSGDGNDINNIVINKNVGE